MSKIITDPNKIDDVLDRGTIVEILPSKKEFKRKLISGEKLRFYIGFDATAPTLHLSHAKNIMLLEKFRKLGHEVIILFGDFTARIGDPSDEDAARRQLTKEDVEKNFKIWKKLVQPLMDFKDRDNPPLIKYNSKWLSKLNFEDLIILASNFTVQQMLERDMFDKRLKAGKPIHLHEFLYPLMQGYDSVAMDVDVEVNGTDQIFNALAGRTLMKKLKNKEKFVVAVTLMENPKTGELMSKSKGTGIFLDAKPNDFFGQIMRQPDEMIDILLINTTHLPLDEIKSLDSKNKPRDAKIRLAYEVTKLIHGEEKAKKAQAEFENVFARKETPTDIKEHELSVVSLKLIDLLVELDLISSKSDGRRLIEQGAVKVDDKQIKKWDRNIDIKSGMIVQVGKRKYAKIA